MKSSISRTTVSSLLTALCAVLLLPFAAKASPVVGNFSITGSDTFSSTYIIFTNPSTLQSSTLPGIHGTVGAPRTEPIGDFDVTMTSFLYASAVGTQLFTLTQNGVTVSFTIYQDTTQYTPFAAATPTTPEDQESLKISGYGYLSETGYDTTSAAFSLTSSSTGAISFQAVGNSPAFPTVPGVAPEPSSLILLGSGMLGLGCLVRRRCSW